MAASTSRTAASAAAVSFTACGLRLKSTHSCQEAFLPQPTFQPLTSPFIPYAVPLAHGWCVCCLAPQGSPCLWGAAMEKAGLGSCFGCCLGLYCCTPCVICQVLRKKRSRIGEGTRPCEQMCSLTSRYKILNSHYLCSPSALAWQGRSSTAAKYGIEEGAVTSFCYACCCPGCSIIQTINQARLHLPTRSPHHLPPTLLSIPWSYIGPIPISSLTSY